MKVPILAVLALVAFSITTQADTTTQTWNVTASCDPTLAPCTDPDTINAVFITQMEFGTYHSIKGNFDFTGYEPVVTSMVGTFDGMAMSLAPIDPGDWLLEGNPEDVAFTAGGIEHFLVWDGFFFLDTQFINWSAVDPVDPPVNVPEAGGILFPLTALDLFLVFCWFKRPPVR